MSHPRIGIFAGLVVASLALGACGGHGAEGQDCPAEPKPNTPSGYCLPRYLSLKRDEVFARKGPGKDYPAAFVYHARGLPVQVIDETTDWRQICDPDGVVVWVHRSMLDGRRTVMARGGAPLAMRASPKDVAPAAAFLRARSVARLDRCEAGWCKLSAGGASGWTPEAQVWGVAPQVQCR